MSNKIALYNKYRPRNFSEVFGQDIIVETLMSAITHNQIHHAYIFSGPKGSGKTSIAKIFSRAINCSHLKDNFDLCEQCNACNLTSFENCLDIVELDAASNNGINEIRNIINSIAFIPNNLKYKVYIIDEAHMLTVNAWNALLKTLEEPPPYVVFIFATTEYNKIPATIISRCQRFDFSRLNSKILTQLLIKICEIEKINIEANALANIVTLADGAARDAISILDQLHSLSKNIKDEDVNNLFGLVNINNKIDLLNSIFIGDIENIILFLNEQYERGINFSLLVEDLIKILFDKIVFIQTNNSLFLKMLDESNLAQIKCDNVELLIKITDSLNSNLFKISKSNDQLFEVQLLLMQIINLINNVQLTTQVPSLKINNKKIEPSKETKIEPNIKKEIFKTKINYIHKPLQAKKESIKKEENNAPSKKTDSDNAKEIILELNNEIKECFFKIACNSKMDLKNDLNLKFDKLKENRILESPLINKFLIAKKILIVSNHGMIALFDNIKQATTFNEISSNDEFLSWLGLNLSSSHQIFGVDKNTAQLWTEEFKQKEIKNMSDIDFKKINNKNDTKSIILDILSANNDKI